MSLIEQAQQRARPTASVVQIVVATLVTMVALFTAQMAALTAWVDTFGAPGGLSSEHVDRLGRPLSGLDEAWHTYGPLLWGLYALALLTGVFLMWRTVLGRPPRAGWWYVPALLALSAVFWVTSVDRFSV